MVLIFLFLLFAWSVPVRFGIGGIICTRQEIQCFPYGGFFVLGAAAAARPKQFEIQLPGIK